MHFSAVAAVGREGPGLTRLGPVARRILFLPCVEWRGLARACGRACVWLCARRAPPFTFTPPQLLLEFIWVEFHIPVGVLSCVQHILDCNLNVVIAATDSL